MRSWSIGIVAAALAPWATAQTAADLFNDTAVQELRIEMRPSDWNTLRANFLSNDYYPADFRWRFQGRDVVLQNVGVRSRGRGSRNPVKPNLRLDFNRFEEGQRFLGLTSAVLKANNQDVSMLKERTIFKLWDRTGLPVSREAHARLYVNDQYFGVYLLTEEIRSEFLARVLGEGSGDVYEWHTIDSGYNFEWFPTCSGAQLGCSTDPNKWQPTPFNPEENKKTFDLSQTINLVRTFNTVSDADFANTVGAMLDFKLWLLHNAIEVFVADFDSILGDVFGMNNFFLYRYNNTSFHQFLPWDKDSSYDWSQRPIFMNANKNVLMRRTLAIPDRRAQYLESLYKVAVLAGGPGGWMEWENNREYGQIKQAVYEDPVKQLNDGGVFKPSTNELFEQKVAQNATFLRERAPWVIPEVLGNGYQPPLRIAQGGVLNAASNAAGSIAPGSLVSVYGSNFTTQTLVVTTAPLPTSLGGVSVIVNGFYAPLLFVSPGQINFQVPWEVGGDSAPFTITLDGPTAKGTRANSPVNATFSNTVSAGTKTYGPGVFLARRADGSAVADGAAVTADDVIVVYATGLGPVTIPVATGELTPAVLSHTTQTPVVTIGGQRAEILFSGLTPGTAGVYQINLRVPPGVPAGGAPMLVTIGGESAASYRLATR